MACALACGCGDKRVAPSQTYATAVELLCSGQTGIANARGQSLATRLQAAEPADQIELLRAAVVEAGLNDCKALYRTLEERSGVELATVTTGTLAPLELRQLTVAISRGAIAVDGHLLVEVRDGQIAATELEGGALGLHIPRLSRFLAAWREAEFPGEPSGAGAAPEGQASSAETRPEPATALTLLVDAATPFRLVSQTLYSVKKPDTGFEDFAFAVRGRNGLGTLGIDLPDFRRYEIPGAEPCAGLRARTAVRIADKPADEAKTPGSREPRPGECAQIVVTVTKEKLLLWSIGGELGSITDPRLDLPASVPGQEYPLDALVAPLSEFLDRVWPKDGPPRPDRAKSIILMLDKDIPFAVLAQLLATVTATQDGRELFPAPLLSPGFD